MRISYLKNVFRDFQKRKCRFFSSIPPKKMEEINNIYEYSLANMMNVQLPSKNYTIDQDIKEILDQLLLLKREELLKMLLLFEHEELLLLSKYSISFKKLYLFVTKLKSLNKQTSFCIILQLQNLWFIEINKKYYEVTYSPYNHIYFFYLYLQHLSISEKTYVPNFHVEVEKFVESKDTFSDFFEDFIINNKLKKKTAIFIKIEYGIILFLYKNIYNYNCFPQNFENLMLDFIIKSYILYEKDICDKTVKDITKITEFLFNDCVFQILTLIETQKNNDKELNVTALTVKDLENFYTKRIIILQIGEKALSYIKNDTIVLSLKRMLIEKIDELLNVPNNIPPIFVSNQQITNIEIFNYLNKKKVEISNHSLKKTNNFYEDFEKYINTICNEANIDIITNDIEDIYKLHAKRTVTYIEALHLILNNYQNIINNDTFGKH